MTRTLFTLSLLCITYSIEAQVIGGQQANQGDYPWMTALVHGSEQRCGGTLIREQWVLTAAHCVLGGTWDKVVINSIAYSDNWVGSNRIQVDTVILHPDYSQNLGRSVDIALMRLEQPSTVAPVALAQYSDTMLYKVTGTPAKVLGWGYTEPTGSPADVLQEADVVVFDVDTCSDLYHWKPINDWEGTVCAGYFEGTDPAGAALKDSGGPLLFNRNGTWIQIGVTSGGDGKYTKAEAPGIFAEVANLNTWIEHTILVVDSIRNPYPTGINDLSGNSKDWELYFSDYQLEVSYLGTNTSQQHHLHVFNALGALVSTQSFLPGRQQLLSVPELTHGLYIVHIEQPETGKTVTLKVVK